MVTEADLARFVGVSGLSYRAYVYSRGELILSPNALLTNLLFITEGSVLIYPLREDGVRVPVRVLEKGMILGDVEFITGEPTENFVEAQNRVICLALPLAENRDALNGDVTFLHTLIHSLLGKLRTVGDELIQSRLEDRVKAYVLGNAPTYELCSIESALYILHCSRRQLQRVLSKLCQEGFLLRTGKGHYRLNTV